MSLDGRYEEGSIEERKAELRAMSEAKGCQFGDSWQYHANTAEWLRKHGETPLPVYPKTNYFTNRPNKAVNDK